MLRCRKEQTIQNGHGEDIGMDKIYFGPSETSNVEINKDVFRVKIIDDSQGLMRITIPKVKDNGPSGRGDVIEKEENKKYM